MAFVDDLKGLNKEKIEEANRRQVYISYITYGNPNRPCILVPPGGGATKENSLFWARDLASKGFFVVAYDIRGTGASYKSNFEQIFNSFGTTAEKEMGRVIGVDFGLETLTNKKSPRKMHVELMEELWDTDAYAADAIKVLDELNIEKAHVMGLSQGGMLSQIIAMQYPHRVITCISAGTIFDNTGLELAMLSPGAEDYYDKVKEANLFDEKGKTPWTCESVSKADYVEWKVKLLNIIIPGFPKDLLYEIAEKEFDVGIVTPEEGSVCGLAWELWNRMGKLKRHHEQLRKNEIPVLYIHGRKDPIIHFGEVERLFRITKNCVLEAHEFGHNFGPPEHQDRILSRVVLFMKKYTNSVGGNDIAGRSLEGLGSDTYSESISVNLEQLRESSIAQVYDTFCSVQTAADTHAVFSLLVEKVELEHLEDCGLHLFMALKAELGKAGLNFKQTKLLRDLHNALLKAQKVVGEVRNGSAKLTVDKVLQMTMDNSREKQDDEGYFNKVLVCGAGPVGLRTACELQLLGFNVVVVEKRPNFSRANILTFWDETMADMLALGAKSYFPNLKPSGTNKHLGTRQIQVSLLKTLLLLGGKAHYGMEVTGLRPPSLHTRRWQACFRPYVKHRRAGKTAAELAVEFQKSKAYVEAGQKERERNEVDEAFVNSTVGMNGEEICNTVEFDMYIIAEGGWSDSTRRLGFSKSVQNYKSIFGLVINAKYNPNDMKEKNMRSQIHFALSGNWPLQRCPIQAEFLEYLKGETHFLALVVPKKNVSQDRTEEYLERMQKEAGKNLQVPQSVIDMMRLSSTQKGLLEMGVLKQDLGTGKQCLAADNVDVSQLHKMARDIMQEIGLPEDIPFYESNPVQLFDFSRRARCNDPVRVLCGPSFSSSSPVLSPDEFSMTMKNNPGQEPKEGIALALPVGDALQEPNWTQGLGINRGFHTAMNQAFVCLLARETSLENAIKESCKIQKRMLEMKWGQGHSGLAGSGSGNIGLKKFKSWDTNPRNRIPYK